MSIQTDVTELQRIREELKLLSQKRKKLVEREKIIKAKIASFLKAKDQPGVKYQGTAIILEEKECPKPKKNKERDADAMSVLEKYGIQDTQKVLQELLEARKGEKTIKESVKIQTYKQS